MTALSGTVCIRPIRIGFVVSTISTEVVQSAARLAAGVWGGVYFPILDAEDPEFLTRVEALALDVLHPLDEDPRTLAHTEPAGFGWRGRGQWGPFSSPEDPTFTEGLLPVDRVDGARPPSVMIWADDPLGDLYDVWLGPSAGTEDRPDDSPGIDDLFGGDPYPSSALARTATSIAYQGESGGRPCIVVVDGSAESLFRLWNLRAVGMDVHPWLLEDPDGSEYAIEQWLIRRGRAEPPRQSRGGNRPPSIAIGVGEGDVADPQLVDVISMNGFVPVEARWYPHGWRGHHPFGTGFERTFNIELSGDTRSVDIALPAMPLLGQRAHWPGLVAADIRAYHEPEFAAGRSFALPAVRALSGEIDRITPELERLHRPTGDGRAVAVQASATSVTVALVPTMAVFETLLGEDTRLGHSDDGRFSSQLIDRLGGPTSGAASQPAVRQVLYDLCNADRSYPIARLLNSAARARGRWPGPFSQSAPKTYDQSVVYRLLSTGLVVPTVSVRCPRCATDTDVRPDDLATDMRCVVCRSDLNLGLALALQGGSNPWRYHLAAHLPPARVRSALAVMATHAVVRACYRAGASPAMPHVFGLTVAVGDWSCEVDVAAVIMDGPMTFAVVGEVKGGNQEIDANDVANLQRVQEMLRAARIETFLLFGTTRDQLTPAEIMLLRAACESSPQRLLRRRSGHALPIVLCGQDVSTPWDDQDHPWRWGTPGDVPFRALSSESCSRNLGFDADGPVWHRERQEWEFVWRDGPTSSDGG